MNRGGSEHAAGRSGPVQSLRSQAVHVAEAGGEAVVVGDDDGRVQGLEVQNHQRVAVEAGLGLHHQRDALRRPLLGSLLHAGGHRDVVEGLGHTEHHGLNTVLQEEEEEEDDDDVRSTHSCIMFSH